MPLLKRLLESCNCARLISNLQNNDRLPIYLALTCNYPGPIGVNINGPKRQSGSQYLAFVLYLDVEGTRYSKKYS